MLNKEFHIFYISKSASSRIGVFWRFRYFFPPTICYLHTRVLSVHIWRASHVWAGSIHYNLLDGVEFKAFRLISSPLNNSQQPLKCRRNFPSLSIFYCYFHARYSSVLIALSAASFHTTFYRRFLQCYPNSLCKS